MKLAVSTQTNQDPVASGQTESSFNKLYKKYVKKVYQKCLSVTKNLIAAQDCTQDIFVKAYANLHKFKHHSRLSTWLYSIAHNYCMDLIRHTKRFATEPLPDGIDLVADSANEPDAVEDRLEQLAVLLANLPDEEAELLRLKYEQNLSIQQLSARYQVSPSAIKMRLKRSREKVQELSAKLSLE